MNEMWKTLWGGFISKLLKKDDKIKIWDFCISKYGEVYLVKGPSFKLYFSTPKEAANHICQNHCNPIGADIHYDCECCPLNNWLKDIRVEE